MMEEWVSWREDEPRRADKPEPRQAPNRKFTMTARDDWTKISAMNPGQPTTLIPYTGVNQIWHQHDGGRD